MTTVLQGNMHRCEAAHLLLPQIATEHDADVLIISEQYTNLQNLWYSNTSGTSAIWIRGTQTSRVTDSGSGDDYVWVRMGAATYVSVYLTPNCTANQFDDKIAKLEDALRDLPGELIVAGDFNSRAIEWGMPETNKRGRLLLEMTARLELVVANCGQTPTYRRPNFGVSIPDVTFVADRLSPKVRQWRVIEDYTASDHQYIVFDITNRSDMPRNAPERPLRWSLKKQDKERFLTLLRELPTPAETIPQHTTGRDRTNALVDETMRQIERLCDETMPRKGTARKRREAYWWTEEIGRLRKQCIRSRRKLTRARKKCHLNAEALSADYKTARRGLVNGIKDSKKRCWRKLCDDVDQDPWGLGYKIVTQRLGALGPPELKDSLTMNAIVDGLFPTHPVREELIDNESFDVPEFDESELLKATASLKTGKAPGPDGIPGEIFRQVARHKPEILLEMYNDSLRTVTFSRR